MNKIYKQPALDLLYEPLRTPQPVPAIKPATNFTIISLTETVLCGIIYFMNCAYIKNALREDIRYG